MQERQRQRFGPAGPSPGSGFFDDPETGARTVTVTHGAFSEELPVAEMTVSEVRSRFGDRLDIHPQALGIIDGSPVGDDTTIRAGQTLMFVRLSGEKGNPCR
jgi:hypothetical protein